MEKMQQLLAGDIRERMLQAIFIYFLDKAKIALKMLVGLFGFFFIEKQILFRFIIIDCGEELQF